MLVVIGSLAYDNIFDFPGKFADHILPDQIHNINFSFIASRHAKRRGGTAGNLVYSLSLLSTPSIPFSRAGSDFLEYKNVFDRLGIDTSHIVIDEDDTTSTGFAITDKNNNQIWGYSYGATSKISDLKLKSVTKKNDLVIIGPCGQKGTMEFVDQAIKLAIPYLFDPSFVLGDITDAELAYGITNCKILIGNDYEMELMKNRIANFSKLVKDKVVITTRGEKGTIIYDKGKQYSIGIAKVQKIVDPSGAGDAWRAGFLAGLERKYDLQTCGQMGSVAASFAIEHYGTQKHTYTQSEFKKRYRQSFKSLIKL